MARGVELNRNASCTSMLSKGYIANILGLAKGNGFKRSKNILRGMLNKILCASRLSKGRICYIFQEWLRVLS